jgi:5-methylthioadenosine/S-adenosylhomocysteine deaminase
MVGAPLNDQASVTHLPQDIERLARKWNAEGGLVRVGLFGQINLDWWKLARGLDLRILTEFSGDWFRLGPEFAEKGVLTTSSTIARAFRKRPGSCSPTPAST